MNKNDLAFPLALHEINAWGLTKREYFLAMALQGHISMGIPGHHKSPQNCAKECIEYVDAIFAELEKAGK